MCAWTVRFVSSEGSPWITFRAAAKMVVHNIVRAVARFCGAEREVWQEMSKVEGGWRYR